MPTDKHPSGRKPAKTVKKLVKKTGFSKLSLLVFCVVFAGIGGYILWRSFAAPTPPAVYLSPASQALGGSKSFSVQIRENSGTTAVNAVQANLTYDSNLLTFVSIDTTGTAFPTQAQNTGGTGTINIARAITPCVGCNGPTGDQLVATINFTTKTTSGSAAVAFASGTALVSSGSNTDLLGSLSATAGGTFTIDATAPTVSLTAPANNASLAQGSTVNVTANASDAGGSVSKVEFYVDGTLASTDASSPYAYAWNTSGLTMGSHTLQAKSYDAVSNVTSSSVITVNLTDQSAPTTPGSFRTTGNTGTTISLAWNASTDNVAVTGYKLSRGGTLLGTLTPGTLSYNDTGLTAGTAYTYTLTAVDAAGNASAVATISPSTSTSLPGDINNDGHVNAIDLSIFLTNFGNNSATNCDLNHDGAVNVIDLSILLTHYGS